MELDFHIIFSPTLCHAESDPIGGLLAGIVGLIAGVMLVSAFIVIKERTK